MEQYKILKLQELKPPRTPSQRPGPRGGVRECNRLERTRRLCQAAAELFVEQGIDTASIGQITRRAGVSKASFYSYFRDKEELVVTTLAPFRAHILDAMDRCQVRIEKSETFEQFAVAQKIMAAELLAGLDENLPMWRLLLQEGRAPEAGARRPIRKLQEEILERSVAHNEAAQRAKLIRSVNPRVMAFINLGAVERLGAGFLDGVDLGHPRQIVEQFADLMLAGLKPSD